MATAAAKAVNGAKTKDEPKLNIAHDVTELIGAWRTLRLLLR
jgi:hypothetical protein